MFIQNSCLFNTIAFFAGFRSTYLIFSLCVNSDKKTLLTVRSVSLGEGVTPSLGEVGRIRLGERGGAGGGSGGGDRDRGLMSEGVRAVTEWLSQLDVSRSMLMGRHQLELRGLISWTELLLLREISSL